MELYYTAKAEVYPVLVKNCFSEEQAEAVGDIVRAHGAKVFNYVRTADGLIVFLDGHMNATKWFNLHAAIAAFMGFDQSDPYKSIPNFDEEKAQELFSAERVLFSDLTDSLESIYGGDV